MIHNLLKFFYDVKYENYDYYLENTLKYLQLIVVKHTLIYSC